MASNFDFLKNIDKDLFEIIEDAQKLFRDEYFNQTVVQLRIFCEKMAKKVLSKTNSQAQNLTLDDVLHCLKDKIETERDKEFIDDLFFIKQQGNKCAHGQDVTLEDTIESIKRAFEASINYVWAIKKDEKIDKLRFDETLLVTQKHSKDVTLVDKYLKAAQENLQIEKKLEQDLKKEQKQLIKEQKQITKKRVQEKIKKAKKDNKELVNPKKEKPKTKKNTKNIKKSPKKSKNVIIWFWFFVVISLVFLIKMIFLY